MRKTILKSLLFLSLFFAFSLTDMYAQPGFENDEETIPLDGGVGLLIASGAAIGARKWYKHRQKK